MTWLISETTDASEWVRTIQQTLPLSDIFGETRAAVIWAETPGIGEMPAIEPVTLVNDINTNGYSLLKNHDPGFPVGKVLAAALFTSPTGTKFIAALLGLYGGGKLYTFGDLALGPELPLPEPRLPALADEAWIELQTDPREVSADWVSQVLAGAPLRVERRICPTTPPRPSPNSFAWGFPMPP